MIQMPMVIEPDQIKHAPSSEIPRPLLDIADRTVMVDVLERRPKKPKPAQDCKIPQERYLKEPDHGTVQQDD
jgi:hypothetical protein